MATETDNLQQRLGEDQSVSRLWHLEDNIFDVLIGGEKTKEELLSSFSQNLRDDVEKEVKELISTGAIVQKKEKLQIKHKQISEYARISDRAERVRYSHALKDVGYTPYPECLDNVLEVKTPFLDLVKTKQILISHIRLSQNGGETVKFRVLNGNYKIVLSLPALTKDSKLPSEDVIDKVSADIQDQLIDLGIEESYYKMTSSAD
jgi:hypothetical protein